MTANTYMTSFTGELLFNELAQEQIDKLANVVNNTFPDLINFDTHGKIMYISGLFDNSDDMVQKLSVKLQPIIDMTEGSVTITAQGNDPKDKWDIVIREDGVFIQEYTFTKGELRKF